MYDMSLSGIFKVSNSNILYAMLFVCKCSFNNNHFVHQTFMRNDLDSTYTQA